MQILGKFAGKFAGKVAPKLGFFLGLAFAYAAGDSLANLGATFTRASSATYIDSNGVLQTASSDVARDGHYINGVRTLLLEGQRTNSFLNSGTPATHTSPSLGTGSFTLWMVGTGSIAVAGATATITGAGTATAASPVTFTVTVAGTVTFTVTGSPTRAQCENGAFASSYIATAGSAVTRSADSLSFPWLYVPQATTLYAKMVDLGSGLTANARTLQIGNNTNPSASLMGSSNGVSAYSAVGKNSAGSFFSSDCTATPAINNVVEQRIVLTSGLTVIGGLSLNGGAEVVGTTSGSLGAETSYNDPKIGVNSASNGANTGFAAFQSIKVALGVQSLATMRGL